LKTQNDSWLNDMVGFYMTVRKMTIG